LSLQAQNTDRERETHTQPQRERVIHIHTHTHTDRGRGWWRNSYVSGVVGILWLVFRLQNLWVAAVAVGAGFVNLVLRAQVCMQAYMVVTVFLRF
jgi:hypothetical protein